MGVDFRAHCVSTLTLMYVRIEDYVSDICKSHVTEDYVSLLLGARTDLRVTHKDMRKCVSARSTLLPLTALCSVNSSKRNIENSMATASRLKRRGREHIEIDAVLLPLLLAAGRTPLQLLFHE